MSNAKQVGTKIAELCRQGKAMAAIETYYADNVVSIESAAMGDGSREVSGKQAVIGKSKWWEDNHEVHSAEVNGPFPHGDDKFALRFNFEVTNKPSGKRQVMDEIAIYQVEGGKIVREEFFYDM